MRRGLTLLELLIVIAVLALLAALLWPVIASAREAGRGAVCRSHLRQLGAAFTLYCADWDDAFPEAGEYLYASTAGWVYCPQEYAIDLERGRIFPYVRDARVYRCPSERAPTRLSYTMNHALSLLSYGAISYPAATVLLIDEDARSVRGLGPNDGVFYGDRPADLLADRHHEGGSLLWADGHVTRLRRDERLDTRRFRARRERE